jgi:hypothetical protein
MKYIPYLYIRFTTPSQHSDNPARWYGIGIGQLKHYQKTCDMFYIANSSKVAESEWTLHELNGKLDSEPWNRRPSGTIFAWIRSMASAG